MITKTTATTIDDVKILKRRYKNRTKCVTSISFHFFSSSSIKEMLNGCNFISSPQSTYNFEQKKNPSYTVMYMSWMLHNFIYLLMTNYVVSYTFIHSTVRQRTKLKLFSLLIANDNEHTTDGKRWQKKYNKKYLANCPVRRNVKSVDIFLNTEANKSVRNIVTILSIPFQGSTTFIIRTIYCEFVNDKKVQNPEKRRYSPAI